MEKKIVQDHQSAAHVLTEKILKKADKIFYRQRRYMEDNYGMPRGTFTWLRTAIFPRTSS